jgi:hypothetical protein
MATVILVAGKSTASLEKFLEDKGSLEITHSFESLYLNNDKLTSGIYVAEKLIYVNQDPAMDVRRDMQTLRDLLIGGGFFRVSEVIVYTVRNFNDGNDFFDALESDLKRRALKDKTVIVPSFLVTELDKPLSFEGIYNALLGLKDDGRVTNSYSVIYRAERNSEANSAYEAEDSSNVKFEPFSYKRIDTYESIKTSMDKIDSGATIQDMGESKLKQDNPSFGNIDVPKRGQFTTLLLSGNPKSGVSVIASAMAVSCTSNVKKVALIDMTMNRALEEFLEEMKVLFSSLDVKSVLLSGEIKVQDGITLVNKFSKGTAIHFLRKFFSQLPRMNFDAIVIDCGKEYLQEMSELVSHYSPTVMIVSGTSRKDILESSDFFLKLNKPDLFLNKINDSELSGKDLSPADIRNTITNIGRIVHPIKFGDLALDGHLANKILGV